MKNGLTRTMTYVCAVILTAAVAMIVPRPAMAQTANVCAYANDNNRLSGNPNTVDGYAVAGGMETYLSPVATGGESIGSSGILDIVLDPTKGILYASDSQTNDIAAMRIDPTTCELTLLGTYPVGEAHGSGIGLAISPNGKWLYAAEVNSEELNALDILQNGGLTEVRQTITLPNRPFAAVVSPDGASLLLGVPTRPGNGNEVISYSIDQSSGMLTQVSVVSPKGGPGSITIDAKSKFVYINEPNDEELRIALMEIGAGSSLTFVRTYNFNQVAGSYFPGAVLLAPNGETLYVTNPNIASLTTLAVNSVTGGLEYISTSSDGTVGSDNPTGLATAKDGPQAFVFTGDIDFIHQPELGIFSATKDGVLTPLGWFPLAQNGLIGEVFPAWVVARTF